MAITQTRYTYPQVGTSQVVLDYRHGQKYPLEAQGGLVLDPSNARVSFFRYVGRRTGRFSIVDYNPSSKLWTDIVFNSSNFKEIMRLQGFEFIGQALGNATDSIYTNKSLSTVTIGLGLKVFIVGVGLPYVAGMRVRAYAGSLYMDGYVESYANGFLTILADAVDGSGTFSSWVISGLNSIYRNNSDWGTNLATNIGTKSSLFEKPGLYADVWEVDTPSGLIGPVINFFRLESNLQTALFAEPRHWYNCEIWPKNIPFRSTSFSNPDLDMMVSVTPVSKNAINPAAYQTYQTLLSTMYVELIEIWFYEHETEGPLDPPVKITPEGLPRVFGEQIFNFFFGKIDPDWFEEPGEYRIKFRVLDNDTEPNMEGGQYHDFWKTVFVDRSVQQISNPISQCYKNAINTFGALNQCTYMLNYEDAGQHLTVLAKGSATDFHEPREKETFYEASQTNVLNAGIRHFLSGGSEVDVGVTISDHFAPLVIADGVQLNPSEPISGLGAGAVIRDYTVENTKIKLASAYSNFVTVVYGYQGSSAKWGKVEIILGDETKLRDISGGYYRLKIPLFLYNNNFRVVFLQDRFDPDQRTVVPINKHFISGTFADGFLMLHIEQAWLESFISLTSGTRYFRFQLYVSHTTNPDNSPIMVRSHSSYMATGFTILPGEPKAMRLPEMIFWNGAPQFRHFDYNFFLGGTSSSSVTISQGPVTLTTQTGRSFYPGSIVVAYSRTGDYMRGPILKYDGNQLTFDAIEIWGSGNTNDSWLVYLNGTDQSNIDFFFTSSEGDPIFTLYDAEV